MKDIDPLIAAKTLAIVRSGIESSIAQETVKFCDKKIYPDAIDPEPVFQAYEPATLLRPGSRPIRSVVKRDNKKHDLSFLQLWFPLKAEQYQQFQWAHSSALFREMQVIEFLAVEIFGNKDHIWVQFGVKSKDLPVFENILSKLPFEIKSVADMLPGCVEKASRHGVSEFGIHDVCSRPPYCRDLQASKDMTGFPLQSLFSAFRNFGSDELALFQGILKPAKSPWWQNIQILRETEERAQQYGAPTQINWGLPASNPSKLADGNAFIVASLRLGVWSRAGRSENLLKSLGIFLCSYQYGGQALDRVTTRDYLQVLDKDKTIGMLLTRRSHRQGMLLNAGEAATLFPLPTHEVVAVQSNMDITSSKPPKELVDTVGVKLGSKIYKGDVYIIRQPAGIRQNHCIIYGLIHKGKSLLQANIALQLIEAGEAVVYVDPHSESINYLLPRIQSRFEDVILFDAMDDKRVIALDLFDIYDAGQDPGIIADHVVVAIRQIFGAYWGHRIERILRSSVYAIAKAGLRFTDIGRLLAKDADGERLRKQVVPLLDNPDLIRFWTREFRFLDPSSVLTKLDEFLLNPKLRKIFSISEKKISFAQIIKEKKVLLVNSPDAALTPDGSSLVNSLIISGVLRAVMANPGIGTVNLLVEEVQRINTSDLVRIMREARKFGLRLYANVQERSTLSEEVAKSFDEAGTIISFDLVYDDAMRMSKTYQRRLSENDFIMQPQGYAQCRIGTHVVDIHTFPPREAAEKDYSQCMIDNTRKFCVHVDQLKDSPGILACPDEEKEVQDVKARRKRYDDI